MRIGILTGGGDCPGLNGVIRGVVTKGIKDYGYEFVGFRDGWKGPLEALTMPLDLATVKPILAKGGTILGSSRTNPFKIENGVERIKQNLADQGIDVLIARTITAAPYPDWEITCINCRCILKLIVISRKTLYIVVDTKVGFRCTVNRYLFNGTVFTTLWNLGYQFYIIGSLLCIFVCRTVQG